MCFNHEIPFISRHSNMNAHCAQSHISVFGCFTLLFHYISIHWLIKPLSKSQELNTLFFFITHAVTVHKSEGSSLKVSNMFMEDVAMVLVRSSLVLTCSCLLRALLHASLFLKEEKNI